MSTMDNELLMMVVEGCNCVWPQIGHEVCVDDPFEMVETCLDADRLLTFGYEDEYAAFKLLLETHSFHAICEAVVQEWEY